MYTLIVWLLVTFSASNPDFNLIEATSQNYVGGQAAAGKGTNYKVMLVTKSASKKISIEQVWCDSIWFTVETFNTSNQKINAFEKNDTLVLYFSKHIKTDEWGKTKNETVKTAAPINFSGKALISYKKKNIQKYFAIENFTQLQDQIRR